MDIRIPVDCVMENSVDCVRSNRQELSVLERAQDVVNILTSPGREFGKNTNSIDQILCTKKRECVDRYSPPEYNPIKGNIYN